MGLIGDECLCAVEAFGVDAPGGGFDAALPWMAKQAVQASEQSAKPDNSLRRFRFSKAVLDLAD